MSGPPPRRRGRTDRTASDGTAAAGIASAGVAAVVGGLLWAAAPWAKYAVYGDRPYVATGFDLVTFVGLAAVAVGVVGFRTAFRSEYGRLGTVGVASTGGGVLVLAALAGRSVLVFVAAGFRAVPATGEDPTALVLTFATFLGLGLSLVGAGALGVETRRLTGRWTLPAGTLLSALVVPVLVLALGTASMLPLSIRVLAVRTNGVFLPLALAWVALGAMVRSRARDRDSAG